MKRSYGIVACSRADPAASATVQPGRGSPGAHARADFPATDPELDDHHSVIEAATDHPAFVKWT